MTSFHRYLVAGVINTVVGYAVFLFALRIVGVAPGVANVACYAVALGVAFLLNKHYVFATKSSTLTELWRFLLSFVLAFLLNQLTLAASIDWLHIPAEISQIAAMAVYTVAFYLLNKWFVFARKGMG
ncbi:GtrA family protein [Castellaniella caeni]|uniref:GtrA family protein n=1 Tax=Castellaniella caeni TaxID=266123 RepID=UPI000C9EE716|nr:GtrA family protein [Castellaniella caeni]